MKNGGVVLKSRKTVTSVMFDGISLEEKSNFTKNL